MRRARQLTTVHEPQSMKVAQRQRDLHERRIQGLRNEKQVCKAFQYPSIRVHTETCTKGNGKKRYSACREDGETVRFKQRQRYSPWLHTNAEDKTSRRVHAASMAG